MQEQPQFHPRDGSSQSGRIRKALDPKYISVDERSIKDLLEFAREYARELNYFDENNKKNGDWSGFLGDEDLEDIVAYLDDPQQFQAEAEKRARLSRPHLTLFLTFLELLQHARSQLNDLTRRHLEFYYREALRLTSRQGTPDQIHVLAELADGQEQFLLPAGTLFQAGQDALDQPVFYRSDEDLVANRATVENTRSLFAEKLVIGIHEARQNPDLLIELFPSNKDILEEGPQLDRSFLAMLMMALGTPVPGSRLEPYPDGRIVDAALLGQLDALLDFVPSVLYMPLSTFRALMKLKDEQMQAYKEQWPRVNDYLQDAAHVRLKSPDFVLDTPEPANFEKNLLAALGRTKFGDFFDTLPEVQDIYDLYRRRNRDDVIKFIEDSMYMPVGDLNAMLGIVEDINARWRQIYEILRAAGRKKKLANPNHELQAPMIRTYEADKFESLVRRTLGTIDYSNIGSSNLDDVFTRIVELETYFHLAAEQFVFIREINKKGKHAPHWEWQHVYAILEEAHEEKARFDRCQVLKEKMEREGFESMILFALGDPKPGDDLPESKKFEKLNRIQDKEYLTEKLFIEPANYQLIMDIRGKGEKAKAGEWETIYTILELAQRRKRNWENNPAQAERWENIYTAADASQVQVRLQAVDTDTTPRWRTFGEGYVDPEISKARTRPGDIGFVIASPILALAEGERKITLKLVFQVENFDKETIALAIQPPFPFRFLLSTEKELAPVENPEIELLAPEHALQIKLSLGVEAPAVAAMKNGTGIQTPWPMLAVMLADVPQGNKKDKGPLKQYRAFQHLALKKIQLKVEVDGLTQLSLQNDQGFLDPKKPFEPFGMSPVIGNSFYFAHPELCSKRLDQLALNIEWLGAPDNLNAHYIGYLKSGERATDPTNDPSTSPIPDNTSFNASLKLYDNRSLSERGRLQLFHANEDDKKHGASTPNRSVIGQRMISERDIHLITAQEVLDWSRYWRLELLDPDFKHSVYPQVAAACANKVVKVDGNPRPQPYIVNPPYTPKIKRLTAGYSSSLELDLLKGDLNRQPDEVYHIEPFGYHNLAEHNSKSYPFLPQFENEGELFIGIKSLAPPQNLSLLFQLAEGSADPNLEWEPVHWDFLDGNLWRNLEEGRLLSDTTNGLLNSGILKLDLPPVKASTRFPADLYWIRATIARNSRSVGDIIAIRTQAVTATFMDQDNDPNRLAQPLPAGSITGLVEPMPEVKAIHQPYSSFGGKSPEQASTFYTRVSERLRHKNRALTSWDYEHMVLEAFPSIYKVKCLPAGVSEDPSLLDTVQVIVIPDIRGKLPFDPFEPKVPADVLWQIEQYLIKYSPPLTQLTVKNPTYIRLKARLGVRLRPDANPGFYKNLLNEELQRYLAPWAYDRSAEIVFGGKINTNLIVNFLEGLPYVDYVAGIKLFPSLDGQRLTLSDTAADTQLEEVSLLAPDAILVSDHSHEIDLITEEGYESEFFTGINYMKIELDFQITAE